MHRVLGIPYLLNEIFHWMTQRDVTVVARVNHEWFASSRSILWKRVELKNALSLLGTLERVPGTYSYRFKEVPDTKKWNRFVIYSSRVLALQCKQEDRLALEVAIRSRPPINVPLFPQCRDVTWVATSDEGLMDLSVFITANLQKFVLQVHDLEYAFFHGICERLKAASPTLKCLQLDVVKPSDRTIDCRDLAQDLLTSFAPHLKFVQIPEAFNTPSILQKLYEIPKLRKLFLNVPGVLLYDEDVSADLYNCGHNGREGFDSLEFLSFGGPQESLCDKFLNLSSFSGLTTLRWRLNEKLSNVDAFIRTIVEGCPQLTSLDVGNSRMYTEPGLRRPVVPWISVRPILQCGKLHSLALHCFQVAMYSKDLTELLTNRTTWTSLEIFTFKPLGLQSLFMFAKYCPNLINLGLFVDGTLDLHLPTPEAPIISTPLVSIDFAFSHFQQGMVQSLASFLFSSFKEPPYVGGWDFRFWDAVSLALAEKCIKQERVTGVPMSPYTKEFVAQAIRISIFSQDAENRMVGVEVDSEYETGSEFEDDDDDDDDGMVIDDAV